MRTASNAQDIDWTSHVTPDLLTALEKSMVGRSLTRRLREHAHEIDALATVHADVRTHLVDALTSIARALHEGMVSDDTVATIGVALEDLSRHGGVELCRMADTLREDLMLVRGASVASVLDR